MTLPTDRYGLPLSTTSSAARDAYGSAVDLLLAAQAGAEQRFARRQRPRRHARASGGLPA